MPDSDWLYHRLFSHPQMVEELVRDFVPEAFEIGLDFSGLQRVNPKFHTDRRPARRREADVIWRLPTRGGSDVYLYLLFEFQKKNDSWMAVRTQVYQGLLWQQIIAEQRLEMGAQLPPLLLLVLYNGVSRWKAATDTHKPIALSRDSPLWHWQPQVRYYLLDVGAFPNDELAARRINLAALLFRLEQRPSNEALMKLVDEVVGWFRQHPNQADLRQLFTELVSRAFMESGIPGPIPEGLLEMKTNLEGLIKINLEKEAKAYRKQLRAEAVAEGLTAGLAEGKTDGLSEALVCVLAERFGAVPSSQHKQIRGANLATLRRWIKRAIAAPDLPSVFA